MASALRREVGMDGGDEEAVVSRNERAVAGLALRLEQVVGLALQLPLGFGEDGRQIEVDGQDARQPQQTGHVVHVALDAALDAGILDLECKRPAISSGGLVDLTDRGRGDRVEVEVREARLPAPAVLAPEHAAHLGGWHGVRGIAQDGQRLRELRGQDVGLDRRSCRARNRAAMAREGASDLARIGTRGSLRWHLAGDPCDRRAHGGSLAASSPAHPKCARLDAPGRNPGLATGGHQSVRAR
jgi:hypothetical protein